MNTTGKALLLMVIGLIIISAGLYVYYYAHTVYPDSGSSRVQDLNWLLQHIGKTGVLIVCSMIGGIFIVIGIRKIQ